MQLTKLSSYLLCLLTVSPETPKARAPSLNFWPNKVLCCFHPSLNIPDKRPFHCSVMESPKRKILVGCVEFVFSLSISCFTSSKFRSNPSSRGYFWIESEVCVLIIGTHVETYWIYHAIFIFYVNHAKNKRSVKNSDKIFIQIQ